MTKLIVVFPSFWNASEIIHYVHTTFVRSVFLSGQTAAEVLYNKLAFTAKMKTRLLRSTNWVFESNSLRSFFKGLNVIKYGAIR